MSLHLPARETRLQVSQLRPAAIQALLPITSRLPPPIALPSESTFKLTAKHHAHHSTSQKPTRQSRGHATIDKLPDEILLDLFNFCVCEVDDEEEWETLVHVCRRWRSIVFGAPRRLDLRLVCTAGTPVREMLDIWPALPIFVRVLGLDSSEGVDNVVAALEHEDRVREIYVEDASNSALETLAAAMQGPFDELIHLDLCSLEETALVLPDSFLGGTAPRLRSLSLRSVPFPALPKLLLSATNIVSLGLWDIPDSGYIPPEAMVARLSALTGLADLYIQFRSPHSDQAIRHSPLPATRTVLPVLTSLAFQGASEYLDHFFAHIDAPVLKYVDMRFFNPAIFEVSQIAPFVGCTEPFKALTQAHMLFYRDFIDITLSSRTWSVATGGGRPGGGKTLQSVLLIKCKESQWQLWSLTQACRPFFTPISLSEVERFDVCEPEDFSDVDADSDSGSNSGRYSPPWADDMENAKWLELLHFFPVVENLYLSEEIALRVALALQEGSGQRVLTDVLPALQNLFIERLQPSGLVQEAIRKFVAERQLSGRPIAVRCWVRGYRC